MANNTPIPHKYASTFSGYLILWVIFLSSSLVASLEGKHIVWVGDGGAVR